jgi:hypothetical protein
MINIFEYGTCAEDILGTGQGDCPITDFGDLKGEGLLKKGTKLNLATDTLNETAFRGLITGGKLHQLINSYSFEDNTPENEKSTSSDGLMQSIRDGKPMFNLIFTKGAVYHSAVHSLKGDNRWDSILYFTDGLLMALDTAKENLKGFNAGIFDVESLKVKSGSEPQQTKTSIQFKDPKEFNRRWVFFTWDELGFNALQIEGVINTNVSFNVNPVAGSTIAVKLSDAYNRSISYIELFDTAGDWKVLTNGVANTVTTVSITGKVATLTLTDALVSTDVLAVSLNGIVADADLKYYKSNTITATID